MYRLQNKPCVVCGRNVKHAEKRPLLICSDQCWAEFLLDGENIGSCNEENIDYGHEFVLAWLLANGVYADHALWQEADSGMRYHKAVESYFMDRFPVLRSCELDDKGTNINLWYALWSCTYDKTRNLGDVAS